jgi:hypothetical protein
MLLKNVALTVVVGAGVTIIGLKSAPQQFAAFNPAGLILLCVSFLLWTVARFQLGNSLTISAQANNPGLLFALTF